MKDLENRNKYLEFYEKETNIFDLNKFISSNDIEINNGAIIAITPNQIVFTRNIPKPNLKIGSGSHDDTYYILTCILYNLPITNRLFVFDDKKLEEDVRKNNYIREEQNILIRMINEGKSFIHMRALFVELPKTITNSQLEFLIYLENIYGETLKTISKEMVNSGELPLLYFKTIDNEDKYCLSFEPLIEYAKNNLVKDNKHIISEEYIIGTTLDNIKSSNKHI